MKKKQIYILLLLVIVICIAIGFIIFKNNKKEKPYIQEAYTVANLKESSFEIPDFAINIMGTYKGKLSKLFLKEYKIPTYEFDASINNGWEVKTNHYKGIKLIDALNELGIKNYSTVEFASNNQASVIYNKEEITDKTFLVFYRDDQKINESRISFLAVDQDYCASLEDVLLMFIQ